MKNNIFAAFILCLVLSACTSVKPYQRIYLNDADMQLGHSSVESFENYAQSIREGATTAGESKSSDGCGCN